jgi:ABC-type branched-subunit amino acid transport system ATPase component
VRTNERAAAALGISVIEAKVYAFALSAGIAAIGGILLAFRKDVIIYKSEFLSFNSILVVGWSFIGGIGYLLGPLTGAMLASGALGTQISNAIFSSITKWIQLIGGAILVLLVLQNQDGLAREQIKQLGFLGSKIRQLLPRLPQPKVEEFALPAETPKAQRERTQPKTLEVRDLTVRYGGVVAVDRLSLTVKPGQIVGLIGPNGAGKTSAIDAITGFTRMFAGTVHLDGRDLSGTSAIERSRAGLSRSFQTLELFEDATVLDNLRAASDPRDRWSYLTDLVHPKAPPLPDPVVDAIHEFQLEDDLLRTVQDLPYGQRRLLAIARAVATQPGVLLLDEPAAGLGDRETAELAHLVRRLADDWGIAVLLVEHDMNFVMSTCDHIVVLDFGRQISEGSPEEVRSDPLVIAAYLGEHSDDDGDDADGAELASVTGAQE